MAELDYEVNLEEVDLDHPLDLSLEIAGGGGTTHHSELDQLGFSESGHTGFEPEGAGAAAAAGKLDSVTAFNDRADDYTIQASDKDKHIRMQKATACNLTINDVFETGEGCTVEQNGDGQVTFVAGAGITLKSADSLVKTRSKYSGVSIIRTPTVGEYTIYGDLTS